VTMTVSTPHEGSTRARARSETQARGPQTRGHRLDPRFARYRESCDHRLRNGLVVDHRSLAVACARRFAHKGEPLADLVQVAMVGLIKAVERFDPTVGVAFSSFAVPTITGELRRHFRDAGWAVHVPRRAKDLYVSVATAVDELTLMSGRAPTVPEIAGWLGASVDETLEALELRDSYRGVPLPESDEGYESRALGSDDRGYAVAEVRQTVHQLLRTLPSDRDREIVRLRFIEELSQSEIAVRIGVSQVQVSRLLRLNLGRMHRALART
jgi:RNA polymerase sigma-B factor